MEVSKVGRKWVYFDNGYSRFDKDTMQIDGGNYTSPGRVFVNKRHYDLKKEANELWVEVRKKVDLLWGTPSIETVDEIEQAISDLKQCLISIELEKEHA